MLVPQVLHDAVPAGAGEAVAFVALDPVLHLVARLVRWLLRLGLAAVRRLLLRLDEAKFNIV